MAIEQKKIDRSFLLKILKKDGIIKQDDELNELSTISIPETFEEINPWNDRKKIYRFTEIANNLFEDFKNLQNIELPNSIISIEWKVFKGCESLTKIKLSENLQYIGFSAFENCLGFNSKDNPLIIPSTVKYIGDKAFKNVPYIYFDGEANGKKLGWGEEVNLALEAKKEDNIKDIFASFMDDDESEEEAKAKAEEEARLKSEEEAKAKAEEEARLKSEEEAKVKAEEEARLKAEEEARLKAEEEARLKANEEARRQEESRKQSKFDESMTVSFWKKLEDFVDEKVKNISYSEEIKQLRSEKIILEKEIRDKDSKLQANNISIESLKIQMQGLEASKESLTKQLEAKEKELFEANKKNVDLAKELAEKKEENLKLDSDNKLLYSIKTNLERELYDKNEVIRMLNS